MMPVMDGLEFRQWQQQHLSFASIYTIVMTADIQIEKHFIKNTTKFLLINHCF